MCVCVCVCVYIYISHVCHLVMSNLATPWIVTCQAPLFMEFSRQEYWSGLPSPSPGGLPNPGIELRSPALQAGSLTFEPPVKYVCIHTHTHTHTHTHNMYVVEHTTTYILVHCPGDMV